jgi:hypothetical protein
MQRKGGFMAMVQSGSACAEELRATVLRTAAYLRGVAEADASRRPGPGKWSAKEIIGHLIDSAAHNHLRFVRARFEADLVFPGYAQDDWVSAQRYQDAEWAGLVDLWRSYNLHVARIIETTPEDVRLCQRIRHNLHEVAWQGVPADQPATLDYFMHDYIEHLQHHLRQIAGLVGQAA